MFDFTIKKDDGDEFKVTADSRDIYTWERTNKGKSFSKLMDDLNMVDIYSLAFITCKRTGSYDGNLDQFSKECVIDFETTSEDDEEEDPTQEAASD